MNFRTVRLDPDEIFKENNFRSIHFSQRHLLYWDMAEKPIWGHSNPFQGREEYIGESAATLLKSVVEIKINNWAKFHIGT